MHDPHTPVLDILMHPIASDSFYILGLVYSKLRFFCPRSRPHYTSKTTVISMVFKNFCIKVVVSLGRAPLNANFDTKLAFIFLQLKELDYANMALLSPDSLLICNNQPCFSQIAVFLPLASLHESSDFCLH